jgi:hypothetical protein
LVAVGSITGASAHGVEASRWRVERTATPIGALTNQFNDVTCTSATACIAVGLYDRSQKQFTLAEARDGSTWTIVPTPNPPGAEHSEFGAIACPSPTECIAVGDSGTGSAVSPLVESWDGSTWTIQSVPVPQGASASQLVGLDCSRPTACTAVGSRYQGSQERPLIEAWDGTAWHVQPSPDPRGFASVLSAVSCTSASACIAVGDHQKGLHSHVLTLAEVWNGSLWKIEHPLDPKGSTTNILDGVSCSGAMHCTAVGTGNGTLAEVWDGSAWTIQPTPNPSDGFGLMALSDVACGRSTACTAVGLYFKQSGGPVTLAERWNGSSWEIQPTPKLRGSSGYGLYAIACPRIHACTAVGFRGAKTLAEGQ